MVGVLALGPGRARAQPAEEPGVSVEGTNLNGIVFTWEVSNHTNKAINYFEIPIFDINVFDKPEGWEIVSAPRSRQGEFILKTDKYAAMILTNRTLTFTCKRPLRDVPRDGRVAATIGFEDGSSIKVPNVLAPVKRSVTENLLPPIFLGLLLIAAVLVKTLKGRKAAGPGGEAPRQTAPPRGDDAAEGTQ